MSLQLGILICLLIVTLNTRDGGMLSFKQKNVVGKVVLVFICYKIDFIDIHKNRHELLVLN
jgi:hypothetical protein